MRLVPYDKKKLGNLRARGCKSNIFSILEEFANSDLDCVKIEGWTQKNAIGCQTSFIRSIKHYNMTNIRVVKRGEEVYLVKKIAIE